MRLLFVFIVFLGAGCSVYPTHSENQYGLRIASISTPDGVEMRRILTDFLGSPPSQSKYVLQVSLERHSPIDQAIGLDDLPSRQRLGITASYLIRDSEGAAITSGSRTATSSYNLMPSPYASQIAAQNTYSRLIRRLSDEIAVIVRVFFENGKN